MTSTAQAPADTANLLELDRAHVIHPHRPKGDFEPVMIVRGEGSRIWDSLGNEYLDATAGLALTHVGHGRPELADAAFGQMRELEYYPSFWEYTNPRAVELAIRILGLAPDGLEKVFFTSGGSEGVEAAVRMARLYQHNRGQPERTVILARHSAYHGVGYGSGSLTGFEDYHVGFGPMLPDVQHLTPPWSCRPELFDGQDPVEYCVAELERTIDELGADRIAAFIGEPIMGVAGMVTPPEGYWERICDVLRHAEILMIADEVISGYGRTGRWFALERYGIEPDIVVTAKGLTSGYLPLGAVLVSEPVAAQLDIGPDGFPIGYTYTGHPTSCAVGLANLALIEREGLVARAGVLGELLLEELRSLERHPLVDEVRGAGLMIGVELSRDDSATGLGSAVSRIAREGHGVIVRAHENVLSLSPPLSFTDEQAVRAAAAIRDALEQASNRKAS
jgi:adenosylmethionine-8-amino-7-oxononanoate aminotransferase